MPTLSEALAAAFDEPATPAASPEGATTTAVPPETEAAATPEASPPAETTIESDPNATAVNAQTAPATPATPDAGCPSDGRIDVGDLKAVRERVLADHPELEPVLNATLAEMQRGLNRKFEQLASLKKEAAEAVVRDERLKQIDPNDLQGFLQLQQLAVSNPAAAADYLFSVSEQLRQQGQNPNVNANPYGQLPPQIAAELQQMRGYYHQQTQQQVIQQIEGEFTKLVPEFGNQAIPDGQKLHVLETIQQRGLGASDIGLVWKSLYGYEYAKQQGIKQGQTLRAQKAGLSAGSTSAPPPPASKSKPKGLLDALDEVCTSHGLR